MYTRPGEFTQVGTDTKDDRRSCLNKHSWGVSLVAVQSNERIECSTSGNTNSHCEIWSLRDLRASFTDDQIIPLYRLTLTIASRIIDRSVAAADASIVQVRNEIM